MAGWLRALIVAAVSVAGCLQAPPASLGAAPAFDLADLSGGRLSLGSLRGKVVVLDFWATWCGPCIAEIPAYDDFWKKNRARGVEVVGVVFDSGEPQEIEEFVRKYRIPYRQLLGEADLLEAYRATDGFPTTFVVDAQGAIRTRVLGSPPNKFEKLQQTVDAALAAREAPVGAPLVR